MLNEPYKYRCMKAKSKIKNKSHTIKKGQPRNYQSRYTKCIEQSKIKLLKYIIFVISLKLRTMRLNHSYIFKENSHITFTYKDPSDQPLSKHPSMFQSLIFTRPNDSRGPLAELTKHPTFDNNLRPNRMLAQSMCQQNCHGLMNQSFLPHQDSVGEQMDNKLAKLSNLKAKEIAQEVIETSIQDFEIGQLLGKGALGNVYACRHKETGFFCAIKKIKKKSVNDINQFINSIKIHSFLDQPNIIKLYSVFDDSEHIYLLMELCMDGNLKSHAKNFKTPRQVKKFLLGIAYGLRHLHRRNIRHGDIKLENIICSYGMPKIADFDCISNAKFRSPFQKKPKTMMGSPLYFSPQMLKQSILGLNDDVWSLGIIAYEILCGYYPFQISSPSELQNILSKEIKPFPSGTDPFLEQLTRKMLAKRVCQRPKLSAIIKQLQRD